MIGVAVHSKHLILVQEGEEKKVDYDLFGAQEILNAAKDKVVLIAGNWRWARTLAYFLESQGVEVRYLPLPGKARGVKMAAAAYLKKAMKEGYSLARSFRNRSRIHGDRKRWNISF